MSYSRLPQDRPLSIRSNIFSGPLVALAVVAAPLAAVTSGCGSDEPITFVDPNQEPPLDEEFVPAPGGMRRLLAPEYTKSIELIFGAPAAEAAEVPVDVAQEGFDAIGASILPLSSEPVEIYERAATDVADVALTDPTTMGSYASCILEGQATTECYTEVATEIGRMLFRRPLAEEEIAEYVEVASFAQTWAGENEQDPFTSAIKYQLIAMLQSPSFLYITEVGEPDGDSGFRKLTQFELASRISFFLLGRTPNRELLDVAEGGELATAEQITQAANALVDAVEARTALTTFYDELFRLRYLPTTPKDTAVFPTWTPELAEAMRQESLLLIDDIVWENEADARTIFNAPYTFVNDALALHYGITPPGAGATQFVKANWPAQQNRAGIISQGAILAHQSGPVRNSPTKRGKFVRQFLLCQIVPPPPDNVVPELPEPPPGGATLQELLEMHMEDPACATCHALTDPVGFAFEHFNGIGAFRTTDEDGKTIDGSGSDANLGEWSNAADLANILANEDRTARCMIQNFIRGKIGHTETEGEAVAIDDLLESFAGDGYRIKQLLVQMTSNPLFRYVGEPR